MREKVVFEANYRGYELNKTEKANQGFLKNILDAVIDLIEAIASAKVFKRPRAYHLTLDEPNEDKLKTISNFLDRQAARISKDRMGEISDNIYYFGVYEQRSRFSGKHFHLYVFVDGWRGYDIQTLKQNLIKSGFAKRVKAHSRKAASGLFKSIIHKATGEIVAVGELAGQRAYHDMYAELNDLVERASYLAKVKTKQDRARKYRSSRLPRREEVPSAKVISLCEFHRKAKQDDFLPLLNNNLKQISSESAWRKASVG
jgi:hypothetical protein